MRRRTLLILLPACVGALAIAMLAGCSTSSTGGGSKPGTGMMRNGGSGTGAGGGLMGGSSSTTSYSSIGERIYLTGVGSDGQAIRRSSPAESGGSYMMSGNGCGSCHGANGRGGTIRVMMGASIQTPDITYDALIGAGFTDSTIKRAIRDGLDEAGKPLKSPMPRWQMSDADVAATIAYLRQLGGR